MSNLINKTGKEMKAPEILSAIRSKDLRTIRILTKILIKEKNLMTINELKDSLEDNGVQVDAATISRWSNA